MAMYIMKGLCVIGIILNVVLMIRKNKELRANPEKDPEIGLTGEELCREVNSQRTLLQPLLPDL